MKSVLIVVDYQKDFVCGALGFPEAQKIDDAICKAISDMRKGGGDIIFTYDTHGEDYLNTAEGRFLPVPHCIKGSDGWQLYGRTADMVDCNSVGFEKGTFGSMQLAEYLASKGYERVVLVGLVSNICVLSNAVLARAALPEATVEVIADATASNDSDMHNFSLAVLKGLNISII